MVQQRQAQRYRKQKSVKVNTERLGDLDRFLFPNGLLVMPVEELK